VTYTYRAGRTSRHFRARFGKPAHRARTGRLEMPSYVHAHLDFLLLDMIRQAPRDAHSVRRELRERFGARSTPSPQLVYSRLHYLERNRLIRPLPADPPAIC
jgi:hypothetical protein